MISKQLAYYLTHYNYQNIPKETIFKAKMCFLDFLGVSMVGASTKSGIIINRLQCKEGASHVIKGKPTSPLDAALINGVFAHSLDLDDGHRFAAVHPGAAVIPAALSLAEDREIFGDEFLASLVLGYQITILLGKLVNPKHRLRGFHTTGTCGTFGAAAAASFILKLGEDEIVNTLGLAGTQTCGLLESDHSGSMAKHLHAGKAAQAGVLSALIAREGFTGAESIIGGEEGFLKAMVGDVPLERWEQLKQELWEKFYMDGVYFKKYPLCRHLHSPIDGILFLTDKNKIKLQNINKIIIETYGIAASHNNYRPKSEEAIRQSLPVSIALALYQEKIPPHELKINKKILDLADKVEIKCNPDFEAQYPEKRAATITIQTPPKKYSETVYLARGEPEIPFSWEELLDKFHDLNPYYPLENLEIIKNLESYSMNDAMNILNQSGD